MILIFVIIDNSESNDRYNFDADFIFDLILSENIDDTNLKHGVCYKQLNLSHFENGIYRANFDQFYNDTDQARIIFTFALSCQQTKFFIFSNLL